MELITKILELEDITSVQKLLLITLKVVPEASVGFSFNDIAHYTSLTRKTVISNLGVLEEAELIEVQRNSTKTNSYKVLI